MLNLVVVIRHWQSTTVAIIEAVPGTPAVPMVAIAAVTIIKNTAELINQFQILVPSKRTMAG